MFIKGLTVIICALVLSNCAGPKSSPTKLLIKKINEDINSHYQLKNGIIFAKYDLLKIHQTSKLHHSEYVNIINNSTANNDFLDQFHYKYFKRKNFIAAQTHSKISELIQLLKHLHSKYKILSYTDSQNILKIKHALNRKNDHFLLLANLDQITNNFPILMPEYNAKITSKYGMRKHPITRRKSFHSGIDLSGRSKASIYAASSGLVSNISKMNGYGKIIEISNNKILTRYAHLSKILVKEGQNVLQGQLIAYQGKTGQATNEHLHFEVIINNKHVNPYDFIYKNCLK